MNNESPRNNRLASLIHSLEHIKLSFPLGVLTFFAIVFARAFLEGIFERSHTIGLHPVTELSIYNVFLHFPVYYLFVFLASLLFLHFVVRERIEKVGKILLVFLTLTLIPPLIDLFATPGRGDALFYFMEMGDFGRALFGTFIPAMVLKGVSVGIRIEVFIGCLLAATYGAIKTRKWYYAVGSFLGIYIILVISGAVPIISARLMSFLHGMGASPYQFAFRSGGLIPTETQRVTLVAVLPLFVLAPLAFYRWSPHIFRSTLRSLKSYLSLHFAGMTAVGFVLAFIMNRNSGAPFITSPLDYLAMFGLLAATLFAHQSMLLFERAVDSRLDDEKKEVSGAGMMLASVLFVSSLLIALSISYVCFFMVLVFALVFFFYLSPPFSIKRFFPLSTISLSFASLAAIILGFSLFAGEKAAFIFPPRISLLVIVLFTLTFSLKDLPTAVRDKKREHFTLPARLGKERGTRVTALLVSLGFLSVPLILRAYLLFIPSVMLSAGVTFIILRQHFRKQLVLPLYLLFAASIIGVLARDGACLANGDVFLASRNYRAANSFMETSQPEEALILYESALDGGYESAALYRNMGLLYLKRGMEQQAIEALEHALLLAPHDQETRILLVQACTRAGDFKRALALCEKGIADGKYRAEFLMLKGEVYLTQKAPSKALKAFKRSIRAGETTGNSLLALGSIYLALDSLDQAIAAYSRALKFANSNQVLKHRAEAHFRNGDLEAALSDLLAAEELEPQDPEIKNNIGIIHFRKGDYQKAERYLLEAIELDRNYLVAYQNLSDTYEKTGQADKAARIKSKINELFAKEHNNG